MRPAPGPGRLPFAFVLVLLVLLIPGRGPEAPGQAGSPAPAQAGPPAPAQAGPPAPAQAGPPAPAQAGPPASAQAAPGTSQAAQQGERLFIGQARFQNGGPPCGSCHQLSTLPFPNGGTIGPDLSPAYSTLGEEGTAVTLQTLFFPTMMPLYEKQQLTAEEQLALKALLQQAAPAGPQGWDTAMLAGMAAAGFLALLGLTWLAWRHRLRGVRAPLVRRAAAGGVRP